MVRVFLFDTKKINDFDYNLINLIEDRKNKFINHKLIKDKKEIYGGTILLDHICKEYNLDISTYYVGENGKPYLDGIFFNLSHSNGIVICAVASNEIGCDIELVKEEPKGIAKKYFTSTEYDSLLKASNHDLEFYRLWTKKESYLKLTGEGILGLKSINIEENVYFKEYIFENYIISVCSNFNEFVDDIIIV